MGRSRKLSYALWSTVAGVASVASLGAAGCGDDDMSGRLADAPSGGPVASVAATLTASAECGVATPPAVDLTIANTGTAALVIQSAVADGGFTVTTALPLTVAPGAQAALAIVPPAAVIGTDRGGATKVGTLTLTTNEVDSSHTVALAANVLGANIAFTDEAGAPIDLVLMGTSSACPEPRAVFIRNTGTAAMTVGVGSASGFAYNGFSGGTIAAGAFVSQMIRVSTPSACSGTAALVYQVTGAVCSASTASLPATFNISGSTSCFCS